MDVEAIVARYRAGGEWTRIDLFLAHPDLREAFREVEAAQAHQAAAQAAAEAVATPASGRPLPKVG